MSAVRAIEFENNRFKVCYSGQLLKGNVNIFFPVPTHVRAIYLTFVGKGFCKWYTGSGRRSGRMTGSKTYLDERIYLLNRSDVDATLPAGDNNYPFSIQLSTKLPTSYEGTYGYIRYVVTLHIEKSAQKIDPLKEGFTIIRPLNLNNQTSFRMPMEKRLCAKFNQFCLFYCWKTSFLKIYGRLPVSGYCPGQTMNLKLDVINDSDKDVLHILIHFIKEITYRSNNGYKKIERVLVAERKADGCRANRNGIKSTRVNITVPSLPPTNFSTDNLCGFHYFFRITAITGFCHRNHSFRIPVFIGTYPISDELYTPSAENDANLENPFSSYMNSASAPSGNFFRNSSNFDFNSSDLPPYPDADPPTYEEAMSSNDTSRNEDFVPKYPTYKRGTRYANIDFD